MNRPLGQAEREGRSGGRVNDSRLGVRCEAGGSDIDGLFKKGPVQWIGLVEDRQDFQLTAPQERLDRNFLARDEVLDKQPWRCAVFRTAGNDLADSSKDVREGFGVVDLDHPLACREVEGLDNAWIAHGWRQLLRFVIDAGRDEPWRRQPGGLKPFAHERLVAGSAHRVERVVRKRESL